MKILFVAPRYHTNQVEWVRALRGAGHEVVMHVLLTGATENHADIQPLVFTTCPSSNAIMALVGTGGVNVVRGFPSPISYFRRLRALRPDILIVRDIGRWFSMLAAACARWIGVDVIIYSQTPLFKHYSPRRRFGTWLVLTLFKAAWITPIRGDTRSSDVPPRNMLFVPFAVPVRGDAARPIGKPVRILSVGKFEERKNHRLLLRALKPLADTGFDFHFTIVGEASNERHDAELGRVEALIDELRLHERVDIVLNAPHAAMPSYYGEADLFVLPATEEPASISVLEALGNGVPVVCSTTCGTRWYVEHGVTGMIFEDGSPDSLAMSIGQLSDAGTLQRMRVAALGSAKQEMSSAKFLEAFQDVLLTRFRHTGIQFSEQTRHAE